MSNSPTSNSSSLPSGIQPDATVAGYVSIAQSGDDEVTMPTIRGGRSQEPQPESSETQAGGTRQRTQNGGNSAIADSGEQNAMIEADTGDASSNREKPNSQGVDRRASQVGKMVGNFLIEAEIASGGMGTVYRATQVKPVRRPVALKMIRRGLDDEETLQRFHSERQALAIMDHPNIAKIYEADTTPFGNPYFAMEYCHGLPIRKFCLENSLSIEARIGLIIQLARAVESAHRLGVIHRDLKPDNVLVSIREGKPELKIIDFGIAKFNDQSWQGDKNATQTGQLVGTPAYMSPEQAEGGTIDARTDVFAMGAILFELLTGTTPLLPPESGCDTIGGIIQYVLSYESVLPSQRVKSLDGRQRDGLANEMALRPHQVKSNLQGDLDWVCLKAIEKDRLDRYATSNDFADDLQRILDHQPVTAAQSSLLYRSKKLFQRRKRTILVTAAISFLLAMTGAWVGWNEYQRAQANAIRTAELTEALTLTLDQAFEARQRAGQGGEHANEYFAETVAKAAAATKTADELKHLGTEPESVDIELSARLSELNRLIESDRAAATLVDNLRDARERATQVANDENDAFGRQAGLTRLSKAFADFGIVVGETDPTVAAKTLADLPPYAQANVIETLDFLLAESPTGAGIYLHLQGGELTVAELVEGGPAAKSDRLRVGDRVLKINDLNLVDGSQTDPATLRSLAYQQLFGAPGETLRVTVLRDQFEPFSVNLTHQGRVSRWTQMVLKSLDSDRWRTELRQAILTGDLESLKRLGHQTPRDGFDIEAQPAFSLIQLASTQFLLERSNQSIDYLRRCQQVNRDHFWANHYLGVALCSAHMPPKPEEGLRYLTAAVALRPESTGARMNLASGYFHVGDLRGQLEELRAALTIDPSYEPLKKQIAMLEAALSVDASAKAESLPPISKDTKPNDPVASESVQDVRSAEVSSNEPSKDFGSDRFDKDSFEYLEATAREHATAGDRAAAMAVLTEIKQRFGKDPRFGRTRGAVLLDLNDVTAASIVLAAAARATPRDAATRFYYGVALQHAGKFQEALHEYRAAVSIQPNYSAAQQAAEALASFAEELR